MIELLILMAICVVLLWLNSRDLDNHTHWSHEDDLLSEEEERRLWEYLELTSKDREVMDNQRGRW